MLDMYKGMVNSPETTITNDISNTDTIIYILDETRVPDELPNLMTLGTGTAAETIKVLSVNGNALTVERGFQGVAKAWNAGTVIARNFTEYDYNALKENIEELETTKETPSGAQVKADTAETNAKAYTNQEVAELAGDLDTYSAETVSQMFNVKTGFGAVGDGSTIDSNAIQNALNAASAVKGTVYIPKGEYIVNGLVADGVRITGEGTLKWIDEATETVPLVELKNGSSINGIIFDGNKSSNAGIVKAASGLVKLTESRHTVIENCQFINVPSTCIWSDLDKSHDVSITNCLFKNTNKGCIVVRSSRWRITNCEFFGTGIDDAHAIRFGHYNSDPETLIKDAIVSNCIFKYVNSTGVLCELGAQNIVIADNLFSNMSGLIKVEYQPSSRVRGIVISGNFMEDAKFFGSYDETTESWTISDNEMSAMSANGPECIFSNNVCVRTAGLFIGSGAIASGNVFVDCGTLVSSAAIDCYTTAEVYSNYIKMDGETLADGIDLTSATDCIIHDNVIVNVEPTRRAINAALQRHSIKNNTVRDCETGVRMVSSMTESTVEGNSFYNVNTPIIYNVNTVTNSVKNNIGADDVRPNVTIDSGSINISGNLTMVTVDTEGGSATDDLDIIDGGKAGQMLTLYQRVSARDVTVRNGAGNIKLSGSNFTIDTTTASITLMYNGSQWIELARS